MSAEIEPQELGFHRPFTVEVSETLKIKNPNPQPIAFKVKTTAPKQYCVRPNSGRVEPGKEVEVQVILQAMKQEPPADTKCRDKFLVQSVPISGDKEFSNLAAIWDNIEKSAIIEKKIRVSFLSPLGGAGTTSHLETPSRSTQVNGHEATPDVAPPAYSSPSEFTDRQAFAKEEDDKHEDAVSSQAAGTFAAATSTIKSAVEPTYEELKAQLVVAEQKISQFLQEQTAGLRQRKTGASSSDEKPATAQMAQAVRQGTEGVPVQITALLCLVAFLIAYLFF